jgi:triosephosphate isomerase
MRARLVAGNWKMHGSLPENATLLGAVRDGAERLRAAEAAVCVPFPYLFQAQQALAGGRAAWGAQTLSQHARCFTGEVSPAWCGVRSQFGVIVCHLRAPQPSMAKATMWSRPSFPRRRMRRSCRSCVGETWRSEAWVTEDVVSAQLQAASGALRHRVFRPGGGCV